MKYFIWQSITVKVTSIYLRFTATRPTYSTILLVFGRVWKREFCVKISQTLKFISLSVIHFCGANNKLTLEPSHSPKTFEANMRRKTKEEEYIIKIMINHGIFHGTCPACSPWKNRNKGDHHYIQTTNQCRCGCTYSAEYPGKDSRFSTYYFKLNPWI